MWGKLRKILSPAPLNSILKLGGIIIYFHLFLKSTTSLLIFLWVSFLHEGSKRTLKAQINSQRLPENQVRSLQIFCVYPVDQKPPQNFSPSQNKENRKDLNIPFLIPWFLRLLSKGTPQVWMAQYLIDPGRTGWFYTQRLDTRSRSQSALSRAQLQPEAGRSPRLGFILGTGRFPPLSLCNRAGRSHPLRLRSSDNTGLILNSDNTELNPKSDKTGLIPNSDKTGLIPNSDKTGLSPEPVGAC